MSAATTSCWDEHFSVREKVEFFASARQVNDNGISRSEPMYRFLLRLAKALLFIATAISLASCDAAASRGARGLAISGYNYTDLYISSFAVNGQGGGNIEVSTPGGSGGGDVCCVMLSPGSIFPIPVSIKWRRDSSTIWCEQEVMLNGPMPLDPHYFEVHFYPDGHVEVAVTEKDSLPRLQLERFSRLQRKETKNVNNDAKFARCADGNRS
jgi:hypothetical protein